MGDMVKIYRSRIRPGLADADIDLLLESSRRNNRIVGVGGMLLFGGGCFLQILEGPGPAVERTYRRILSDPRHTDPVLLYDGKGEPRRFVGWAMGFARLDPHAHMASVAYFLKQDDARNPGSFGSEAALRLLLDLRRECAGSEAAIATCAPTGADMLAEDVGVAARAAAS
ncbi:MAG: BLUF domain-containing protein [Betaproteobacteria bacterium]|nr:MAG: BLUF domain-containing protein [Betaproteobacteria bacterium]